MNIRRQMLGAVAIAAMTVLLGGHPMLAQTGARSPQYSAQNCPQWDREYKALQQKQQQGRATDADRARMSEIDGLDNVYCQ